jgi:NifU-like protein involved in Fe-S cluster formation
MNPLFTEKLTVINVGLEKFTEDIQTQGGTSIQLDWAPPGLGNEAVLQALTILEKPENLEKIQQANQRVFEIITSSSIYLTGYAKAIDVVPGMKKNMILHAGPPITWEKMNGPMQGAVLGAIVFEGFAENLEEAQKVAQSGQIEFSPCHEHNTVGSMAGITSASMYVHIVENKTYGNVAYTNLSEQLSKILRMGANDDSVIERLIWMRDVFGPILAEAMTYLEGGIDLRLLVSQALHMGDELHNRNVAGTTLLIQALTPGIIQTDFSVADQKDVFDFVASSDYFSGPTWMAFCKAALDAAVGVEEYSSVVTTMARNGTEFGIRLASTDPKEWFIGPSQKVIGPMFAGYTEEDSGLDIGDSAITETFGLGGFSMAAAPAIVALVGDTVADATNYSLSMEAITTGENPNVTIPALNFMGIPTGIDILKVMQTNTLPVINTAIAHKEAGIGMIGAGITYPPVEAFQKAIVKLSEKF